jgi:UDP-glucose:(heptosyl)LPS alpha-1,3-glucosyltransferase
VSPHNCRRIIAMSNVVKKELMGFYHVPANKIEVIYNGVDTSVYHPRNRETYGAALREQFGIKPEHMLILFVGTGFLRKGLEFVLSALALLRDDRLRLLVVGRDAAQARYEEIARQLRLADAVVFAGPQKDIYRFYGAADIVALPSLQDPFGNVVLEALSSGVPAITTKNVGASEIMEGRLRDYILEQADDVQALAGMIRELTDRDLRVEISLLARKTAEKYSRENNARAMERLCRKVAEEKALE